MSGHLIGTSGSLTARRAECVHWISQLADSHPIDAGTIAKLRRALGNDLAAVVVSVASLQRKAVKKFGPGVWWVTERSLQQATPWQVARLKASWLGDRTVYDLCCGVGGDAIQLAKRGPVMAVDLDPTLAEMAAENLVHCGAVPDQAQAICFDATTVELPKQVAVHIDPDRRVGGGRHSQPNDYMPSWPAVLGIIAQTGDAVVKLAPAAKIDEGDVRGTHRCWQSLGGSVREQSLLCGAAVARAGLESAARSAVSLSSDGTASWFKPSACDLIATTVNICDQPLSVLVDPDASIRAAGLTETFARKQGLKILGAPSGFLTCDEPGLITPSISPMVVAGNVIWSGSCDDRKLRKEFRSRNIYPAVIKVRGTDYDPAVLTKRYRKCGDDPVTLWIGRAGKRVFAAITRPLADESALAD